MYESRAFEFCIKAHVDVCVVGVGFVSKWCRCARDDQEEDSGREFADVPFCVQQRV